MVVWRYTNAPLKTQKYLKYKAIKSEVQNTNVENRTKKRGGGGGVKRRGGG